MTAGYSHRVRRPTPLLALDLDGTVRHGPDLLGRFVGGPGDVVVFPEAVVLMCRWRDAGGRIIGVTNQGGVALGHLTPEMCAAALRRTHELTGGLFDRIQVCPHHPDAAVPEQARCWCRKPSPGLLIEGALALAAVHPETYPPHLGLLVGDRPEDSACAELAGFPFMRAADWRAQA